MSVLTIGEEIAVDDVSFGGDVPHARGAPSKGQSLNNVRAEGMGNTVVDQKELQGVRH